MRVNRPRGRTPAARVEIRLSDSERDLVKVIQTLTATATGREPSASAVVSELVRRYGNRHLAQLATKGRPPEASPPTPAKVYKSRDEYLADHPDYLESHNKFARDRAALLNGLLEKMASSNACQMEAVSTQ